MCGVAQSRSKPEENHTNRLQLYPTGDSQSHVAEEEQQGEKNQDALFNCSWGMWVNTPESRAGFTLSCLFGFNSELQRILSEPSVHEGAPTSSRGVESSPSVGRVPSRLGPLIHPAANLPPSFNQSFLSVFTSSSHQSLMGAHPSPPSFPVSPLHPRFSSVIPSVSSPTCDFSTMTCDRSAYGQP